MRMVEISIFLISGHIYLAGTRAYISKGKCGYPSGSTLTAYHHVPTIYCLQYIGQHIGE